MSRDETGMTTFLRYVPHGDMLRRLAEGWRVADELHGCPHGEHAVLMVWNGELPLEPQS